MNRSITRDRRRRSNTGNSQSIVVTDNIVVRFEGTKRIASFKLVIFNDSDRCIEIQNVDSDLETVVVRMMDVNGIRIRPDRDFSLSCSAVRHYDEVDTMARIRIFFKNAVTVTRYIQIIYNECAYIRKHAYEIQRQKYPIPKELFDIMDSVNSYEERMAALDALDALIPATDQLDIDNYSEYFHGLLYLEQSCIERNFQIYHRDSIVFQQTKNRYAIQIEDLFETRPSLSIGDWAFARKNAASHIIYEGRVVELEENLVRIAFGNDFKRSFKRVTYEVTFLPNSTTFLHGHRAIDLACKMFDSDFLFPQKLTELRNPQLNVTLNVNFNLQLGDTKEVLPWFNNDLNNYQREAVKQVLRADCGIMPHIIYGPPGTGKSTTLTETILQLHRNIDNSRILVSAQSNSTVNLLAQLLIESGDLCPSDLLRLTSICYVKADKMPYDLIAYSATVRLNVSSSQNDNDDDVDDHIIKQIKNIDDIKQLKDYRLIIGTTAAMSVLVESPDIEYSFSHVIIDEAGQCTEVDCLIPMLMAGKQGQVVLAGDGKQMPALVFDIYARDRGLSRSFLCRLLERYAKLKNNDNYIMFDDYDNYHSKLVTKLVYNYRSLPCILNYVNEQFYNLELMPMVSSTFSRESETLKFVMDEGIVPHNISQYGIYFFNVHGINMKLGTTSWSNEAEMHQISDMVQKLIRAGISDVDIGVISPYYLQVRMIRRNLCENSGFDIAVGTVEEFQGQEKLIILLSTVRTCKENARLDVNRQLGFLNCPKRLNVAASRARALFVVFGKAELLEADENWRALIDSCKSNGTFIET